MVSKYKSLSTQDQFKGLDRSFSAQKEAYGYGDGADENLIWHYISKDNDTFNTTDLRNLFMSFGLARQNDSDQDELDRAFGFVDWYKANSLMVAQIPQSACSSYIDGSTVKLRVPTGTSSGDYVTFYGATYKGIRDASSGRDVSVPFEGPSVYGGVYCYLFPNTAGANSWPDSIHGEHPYTGSIDGSSHPNAGLDSWTDANTENKTFYPHLRATQWTRRPDDGRDVPFGIAFLEQGLFVLFDMPGRTAFVDNSTVSGNTNWGVPATLTAGTKQTNSNTANRRDMIWTGAAGITNARLTYRTVTEDYKLVYFCHAGQNEFNSTTNHTYDHRKAFFRPEEADDIYVTEIALYDDHNEVLAYAKLSEPVAKNQLETLTFKVELNIGSD